MKQRQKHFFTIFSGGFVILKRSNSFIDSKYIAFFRAYLTTILKALVCMYYKKSEFRIATLEKPSNVSDVRLSHARFYLNSNVGVKKNNGQLRGPLGV